MAEPLGDNVGKQVELYDQSRRDREASGELLDAIRVYFRDELDRSDFTRHFIDALNSVCLVDSSAQLYVAQTFREGNGIRTILAVLKENKDNGFTLHTRVVGEEMNDLRMPARCFTNDDLDLAISQLASLQELQDQKIISLDQTLSWPVNQSGIIM